MNAVVGLLVILGLWLVLTVSLPLAGLVAWLANIAMLACIVGYLAWLPLRALGRLLVKAVNAMMRGFWAPSVVALVAGCASASGGEAWRDVRITYDRQAVSGCQSVGIVSDEKWTRLQKDAYEFGGNTVLVVGGNTGVAWEGWRGNQRVIIRTGEAYRCPSQVAR